MGESVPFHDGALNLRKGFVPLEMSKNQTTPPKKTSNLDNRQSEIFNQSSLHRKELNEIVHMVEGGGRIEDFRLWRFELRSICELWASRETWKSDQLFSIFVASLKNTERPKNFKNQHSTIGNLQSIRP